MIPQSDMLHAFFHLAIFIQHNFEQVTQGLSEQPNKVKQDQQPGKKRKTAVEEKGKKAKIAVKKILKPQILSGEDIPAVAGKYGPSTQGQSGENQTDDILNKYKFLTVTKSATPLKLKSNDSVQRKGVPKIKAKVGAKKVKGSLKNISVAHRERGKDGVEEEKTDQAASLGSQADQVEAAAGREQMESTASSLVNYLKEESETSVDHIEKFSNEEENTVNTANILNKYKFLTDLLPAPRKDEEVEEVTMEETTAEDLLGKAEGRGGTGSDLVEATVKKGKEPSAKISKKSRATVVRKDIAKGKVPCGQCEKTFANSSSLKQHITIHTNEKPYLCKECPDKFRNFNMLSGHRKKVHPKSLPDKTDTVPPV